MRWRGSSLPREACSAVARAPPPSIAVAVVLRSVASNPSMCAMPSRKLALLTSTWPSSTEPALVDSRHSAVPRRSTPPRRGSSMRADAAACGRSMRPAAPPPRIPPAQTIIDATAGGRKRRALT